MKRSSLSLGAAVLTLLLAACVTQPVALAPSTIPLEQGGYTVIGETSGTSWGVILLGFPLMEPNQVGQARDRAIESAQADALVNVAVDMRSINLVVLPITILWTNVYGDAVHKR